MGFALLAGYPTVNGRPLHPNRSVLGAPSYPGAGGFRRGRISRLSQLDGRRLDICSRECVNPELSGSRNRGQTSRESTRSCWDRTRHHRRRIRTSAPGSVHQSRNDHNSPHCRNQGSFWMLHSGRDSDRLRGVAMDSCGQRPPTMPRRRAAGRTNLRTRALRRRRLSMGALSGFMGLQRGPMLQRT